MRISPIAAAITFFVAAAQAQVAPINPDWREAAPPPPPVLRLQGLIPLEIPRSNLRFGVDPASVSLGEDSVVRYVVVASSATGAVNAMYEGIRCGTGEVRVYARHNPDSGWTISKDSTWRSLHEGAASRHSLLVARTGACIGHGPNGSAATIVRDLSGPADARFRVQ